MRLLVVTVLIWRAAAEPESSSAEQEFFGVLQVGQTLQESGQLIEARREFARALEMAQRLGPASEAMASTWLASAFLEIGRVAEAERVLSQSHTLLEQMRTEGTYNGEAHAKVLTTLGAIELQLGRTPEAERRLLQALSIWRGHLRGSADEEFATLLNNLAILRYRQRQLHDAEQYMREALGIWRNSALVGDHRPALGMAHLAGVLSRLGKVDEADRLSAEALESLASSVHPNPTTVSNLMSIRAQVLRKLKRGREAKALEIQARDVLRQNGNPHIVDLSVLSSKRVAASAAR